MAIEKIQGPKTPDKMLQIHNMQKSFVSNNILDCQMTEKDPSTSTIHSGHFMVSRVHEEKEEDDEEEVPIFPDDSKEFEVNIGFDFTKANRETSQNVTFQFGPKSTSTLSIDASLTKLFQCMTLAYSGKITSPKWKPFRGMHLTVKDKVRLNNIIWREWHMQYIYMRRPIVCQFATPLSDDVHTRPEAVVLEGKYWKRRMDVLTKEYKKWRRYFRDRIMHYHPDSSRYHMFQEHLSEAELLEKVKDTSGVPRNVQLSSTDLSLLNMDLDMDFSDNLFSSLNQPFPFPNPRELNQFTCADLIQPGLVQLQPNLDDYIMDIDTMQEFLQVSRAPGSNTFSSNSISTSISDLSTGADLAQSALPHSMFGLMDTGYGYSGSSSAGINMLTALAALSSNVVPSFGVSNVSSTLQSAFSSESQMLIDDSSNKQSVQAVIQSGFFDSSPSSNGSSKPAQSSLQTPSRSSERSSLLQGNSPRQNIQTVNLSSLGFMQSLSQSFTHSSPFISSSSVSSPQTLPAQVSCVNTQAKSVQPQNGAKLISKTAIQTAISPKSTTSGQSALTAQVKKDYFAVPQVKAIQTPKKPRTIAPAPTVSSPATPLATVPPSMQSTFLAQLLTQGTYPGALINNVKKEPSSSGQTLTTNYTPILPAIPTSNNQRLIHSSPSSSVVTEASIATTAITLPTIKTPRDTTVDFNKVMGADFATSVVLAAANSTFRPSSSSLKDVLRISPAASTSLSSAMDLTASPTSSMRSRSPTQRPLTLSPAAAPSSPESFLEPLSPSLSPMSVSLNSPGREGEKGHTEQRRKAHLSAEQKRRCNLKSGFDLLHTLVPSLAQNPKVSKATMLQKTAEHCRKLKAERAQMQQEAGILKQEIDSLNTAISVVQSQLPETGVPVTRQRVDQMKEMFDEYVRNRTLHNWKFWIFSIIIRNLFDSYNNMVSTASMEELCRTTLAWLDQHCSLVSLRPTVLNALRHLSTTTSILTEPQRVREQATKAVTKGSNVKITKGHGNNCS